jgi:L-asparaginase
MKDYFESNNLLLHVLGCRFRDFNHKMIGSKLCYYSAMSMRLIVTGGTIDKQYNELTGQLGFDEGFAHEMLDQARFTSPINIEWVLMKDSLDMTEEDREEIAQACDRSPDEKIVITHGTDTMINTAQVLAKMPGLGKKTIVLVGAMVPFSFGVKSDASFNLGAAIAFVQTLPPGVYIAMNGRYFTSDNVRKDRTLGVFSELENSVGAGKQKQAKVAKV